MSMHPPEMPTPLLEVRELSTWFDTDHGVARAVDGVSFSVPRGRTVGLVGESGCGKSVSALSILGLVKCPPGRIVGGEVRFEGRDILRAKESELRRIRGNRIAMIFQEPMVSLNPVFTAGAQIAEVLRLHRGLRRAAARQETIALLRRVGLPAPEARVDDYPHQMSGGMKQRVMIAMAIACRPALLIADEPTTALDVTIQAQILALLGELQKSHGMAILLITHDLGVVAERADEVVVMYAGRIVERAPVRRLFAAPRHPYTQGLLRSRPRLRAGGGGAPPGRLEPIPGQVPSPVERPTGCRFRTRCAIATAQCAEIDPPAVRVGPDHLVHCLEVAEA